MKKLLLSLLIITQSSLWAQEIFRFQTKSEFIEFSVSQEQYFVTFQKENKNSIHNKTLKFIPFSETSALVLITKSAQPFAKRKTVVMQQFNNQIERIEPVLLYHDSTQQICQGQLILKLKGANTLNGLLDTLKYTAERNEFVENQYIITIQDISTLQLFELVSILNQNENIEFAEPNFTRLLKPHTSDTFYNSQWAISNQGYLGGSNDADMDVDDAWSCSTGQGIKVAIIDEGVDIIHPDLAANLLSGYDATGNNSNGAPQGNDAHGTNCAGIVGAVANNGIGVAGIAYNSKIIPVRIAYSITYPDGSSVWNTNDYWIANGINWAVNQGADVLSCSWGGAVLPLRLPMPLTTLLLMDAILMV